LQETDVTTEIVTKEKLAEFTSEARRLLAMFQDPVWASTDEQTDEQHLADYTKVLARTRLHFPDMQEKTLMNSVMNEGDQVLCFTGNSPTSPDRARAIVGFLRNMPFLLNALEALVELRQVHSARVTELITHNSEQLMENRAQRQTIRQQQAMIDWLMSNVPGVMPVEA
jgi:hypothetical protein